MGDMTRYSSQEHARRDHGLPRSTFQACTTLPTSVTTQDSIQNLNPLMDSLGQTLMVELSLVKLA